MIYICVNLAGQRLRLLQNGSVLSEYPVSTAKNGAGERLGSECTPRGWHKIRAKIGRDTPLGAVFIGRRPTGEIYTPVLAEQNRERDWILSRILWLSGLEPGFNRFGQVDTFWRYIYLHGSPDEQVDTPISSHGCIRMKNRDIIDLFDRVEVGTKLFIEP